MPMPRMSLAMCELPVSFRNSVCGYRESNPNLVLGKDAFYH